MRHYSLLVIAVFAACPTTIAISNRIAIAEEKPRPGLVELMDADKRRWPDLTMAIWAVADPSLSTSDRIGVASRLRGALAGAGTQGDVFGALFRTISASGAFFSERKDCAGYDQCEQYRRIGAIFEDVGRDLTDPWYHSGAADMIVGFERAIRQPGWSKESVAAYEKQLRDARELRKRGIDGVVSLRRHAEALRVRGESTRAWRLETIAQAIADHPEEPL